MRLWYGDTARRPRLAHIQFLSPSLNTRKDKWGGPDIENRARLAIEILKAIRQAVGPRFPIEMRISGSECYAGGYGIEEGIKFSPSKWRIMSTFCMSRPAAMRSWKCSP